MWRYSLRWHVGYQSRVIHRCGYASYGCYIAVKTRLAVIHSIRDCGAGPYSYVVTCDPYHAHAARCFVPDGKDELRLSVNHLPVFESHIHHTGVIAPYEENGASAETDGKRD